MTCAQIMMTLPMTRIMTTWKVRNIWEEYMESTQNHDEEDKMYDQLGPRLTTLLNSQFQKMIPQLCTEKGSRDVYTKEGSRGVHSKEGL